MPLILDGKVTSIAHITGGGLVDNPPRVFAKDLALALDMTSWSLPRLFAWLQQVGQIAPMEMLRTFNCGIGMLITVEPEDAEASIKTILDAGYTAWQAGTLIPRGDSSAVRFDHLDQWKAAD
jgi:phosphoribosylformylglycinamidine cyclo-ligase